MAKLNFPTSPSVGTLYSENGNTWRWNGTSWISYNSLDLTNQVSGALGTTYGGTGFTLYSVGDTLFASTANSLGRLAAGASNYVLTSNGPGTAPSWQAISASAASGLTSLNSLTSGIQYFSTGTSGSGFNISSSGSTHTFNIPIAGSGSTGLISTQAQTIAGAKTFSSDFSITSSTASTNSSTGALVITGGVGIGDSLFVAGNISFSSGTNGLLFRKLVAGNFGAIYSTNVTPSTTNYSFITDGASLSLNGTNGVYLNISNTNKIQVTTNNINIVPTTDSTSSSTGALTVAGGVGIGGSLYVASATAISGVTINNGIITGNLTGTATTAGFATTASTANAWTTPRVLTLGGDLTGNVTWSGSGDTTLNATIAANSVALGTDTTGQYASTLSISGSGITATAAIVDDGTAYTIYSSATSNNTASSIVLRDGSGNFTAGTITANLAGTATTAQNLNVNTGNNNIYNPVLFSPQGTGSGVAVSSSSSFSFNPTANILNLSGLAITSSTASTNSTTGALVVTGGVGIGGSLYVNGDLTINGTTTTINSVTLTVDDKNIELGSVNTPSDVTAEGGGITLKGATDKYLNWYTGTGWSSSESFNLINGNTYKISNTSVLSATSLGTGVTNSSLSAVGTIRTGTWSGSLITAFYGGTGYNSYSKGDILVGAGNTLAKLPVGNDLTILTADSNAGTGLSWKGLLAPTYGAFASTSSQPVNGANTLTYVNFNTVLYSNNVTIGTGVSDRVYIYDNGVFDVQFSSQCSLASQNQAHTIDMWFVVDGIPVPNSGTRQTVLGKDYESVLTVNLVQPFISGQYIQLAYSSPAPDMQLGYFSNLTSPTRPNIPSIFLTIEEVSSIIPGSGLAITGLASLNLLTSNAQTLVTGTSGSDFNISSIGSVHTFNIPDASTTARGLITTGSQTIGGSKTFASSIIGSLSGTATTATNINVVFANSNGNHPILFTPTFGSASGIAVSSNTTLVYNAVSDILSVSGAAITASTASTSTSTGALIVSGGVGIGASLNVGTSIVVDSGVFGLSLQRAVGASLGAIYSTAVTPSSSNYSFATDGTNLNLNSTNNVNLNISNTSKLTVSTNNVNVGINVASTSQSTGAFTVTGGAGIGGSLYVGSASSISGVAFNIGSIGATSTTNSTTSSTGAITVTGGVGIGQSASIGGRLQLFNGANYTAFVSSASGNTVYTLPATSPATGTSVLQSTSAGVMSWVPMTAGSSSGNTSQNIVINSAGNANIFHPVLFTPSSSSSGSAISSDSTITFIPSTKLLSVSGLAITSGTASTNTSTGGLLVNGGLGISGQLTFTRASLGFTGVTGTPDRKRHV